MPDPSPVTVKLAFAAHEYVTPVRPFDTSVSSKTTVN